MIWRYPSIFPYPLICGEKKKTWHPASYEFATHSNRHIVRIVFPVGAATCSISISFTTISRCWFWANCRCLFPITVPASRPGERLWLAETAETVYCCCWRSWVRFYSWATMEDFSLLNILSCWISFTPIPLYLSSSLKCDCCQLFAPFHLAKWVSRNGLYAVTLISHDHI